MKFYFSVIFLLLGAASAQERFKICATETVLESTCNALERSRSTSQVSCIRVTDSAECSIKLAEGKADLAVFGAEEMLLAYQFYPDQIQPITQLRHIDRLTEDFNFQSVAVVPSSFDSRQGLEGLKKGGFCHPGFSDSQIWNDRILKYFEKKSYDSWCRSDLSATENEAENLKNYFGTACRPGEWVEDKNEDKSLKAKYPQLCELCDDVYNCQYHNTAHNGHFGALECLTSGRGKAAYVAFEYVRQFFGLNTNVSLSPLARPDGFQFLCADGTTRPLTSNDPCGWIRQPWKAVVARKEKASTLLTNLRKWLVSDDRAAQDWTVALRSIILSDDAKPIFFSEDPSLKSYLMNGREVDLSPSTTCGKSIRWCTVNEMETNKCKWVAKEALALGIEPSFSCVMTNSTFDCLRHIAEDQADIITIDSNYGLLARTVFNLTTSLYAETSRIQNSKVIAIIREDSPNKVSSFKDLKKRTACFPEYGGIAWMSFLNIIRKAKIISNECDYPLLVSQFLSRACAPGINDADHTIEATNAEAAKILCSLCPVERGNVSCSANEDNFYYGDKGALECLKSGAGDIAFVESKNLLVHVDGNVIYPNDYRVLCKNGSLATFTGFDVDDQCALSVTIDSEVVTRKNKPDIFVKDANLALLKIENWLGYRVDVARPIRIYDSFRGNSDLLFKDSTIGLVPSTSEISTVMAYKELFDHQETCSGVGTILPNTFVILLISFVLFHR